MSEESNKAFELLQPALKELEEAYEKVSADDPIGRGHIGRQILELVHAHNVSTEYLRYCQRFTEADLSEPQSARIDLVVRILGCRGVMY